MILTKKVSAFALGAVALTTTGVLLATLINRGEPLKVQSIIEAPVRKLTGIDKLNPFKSNTHLTSYLLTDSNKEFTASQVKGFQDFWNGIAEDRAKKGNSYTSFIS